jgi:hypothetical protein
MSAVSTLVTNVMTQLASPTRAYIREMRYANESQVYGIELVGVQGRIFLIKFLGKSRRHMGIKIVEKYAEQRRIKIVSEDALNGL